MISNCDQIPKASAPDDERRTEYLDRILDNVRRLSDLVANILKPNKIEKQVIKPVFAPYDLCSQMSQCALLFESAWEEKDIELVVLLATLLIWRKMEGKAPTKLNGKTVDAVVVGTLGELVLCLMMVLGRWSWAS